MRDAHQAQRDMQGMYRENTQNSLCNKASQFLKTNDGVNNKLTYESTTVHFCKQTCLTSPGGNCVQSRPNLQYMSSPKIKKEHTATNRTIVIFSFSSLTFLFSYKLLHSHGLE